MLFENYNKKYFDKFFVRLGYDRANHFHITASWLLIVAIRETVDSGFKKISEKIEKVKEEDRVKIITKIEEAIRTESWFMN